MDATVSGLVGVRELADDVQRRLGFAMDYRGARGIYEAGRRSVAEIVPSVLVDRSVAGSCAGG